MRSDLEKRLEALEAKLEPTEYRIYWHDDLVPAGVTPLQIKWLDEVSRK